MKVLVGLLALGLVVFVHEFGHFLAARLCGVEVETFSIGWGPVLFRKKHGKTEYRISALPLGGYCGMKGEHAFTEALEKKLDAVPRDPGSLYGASPFRRMAIAVAGPFANLLFAVLALSLVSAVGTKFQTYDNRIIPASLYDQTGQAANPADRAGLAEGDRIISLGGTAIGNFTDLQQYVGTHPGETLSLVYERNGTAHTGEITPALDKKTGAGKIGVYPYIPLVVGSVRPGSAAESAGIRAGDRITAVNGKSAAQYLQFSRLLEDKPEQVTVSLDRNGIKLEYTLVLLYPKTGIIESGISWQTIEVRTPGTGFFGSIRNGIAETGKTLVLTVKSIALLFRGVDVTEAVSGPVRITMLIGEVAGTSLTGVAELLGIICVSLFLMNLLPIPVLDGGMVLFSIIEIALRKPLKPKTLYYVQFIGIAFIMGLFILALFGDIRYLIK